MYFTAIQKVDNKYKNKKSRDSRLKPTRNDNSKGTRVGPSLFYTSKINSN